MVLAANDQKKKNFAPNQIVVRRIFSGDITFMNLLIEYIPEVTWAITRPNTRVPDPLQRYVLILCTRDTV